VLEECKGNATVASRISEKFILVGEFQTDELPFIATADSERREQFTECDRMLAVHVLCVMCGWRSRNSRSLKDRL
jgi:hypothetical protein